MSETQPHEEHDAASDATDRIGERLTQLRAERNIRISDLARVVSVSPSLISQIERGQSRPSVKTLFALAQALSVPVDELFGGADAPPPGPPAGAPTGVPVPTSGEAAGELLSGTAAWQAPVVRPGGGRAGYMLHREQRARIDIRGGVRWERLTPTSLAGLEFLELVYAPNSESDSALYRHPGIELVLVLSNRLDIHVGFDCYELGVGDSIAFPSSTPHRYVNPTDEETRAVTVIVRDDLSQMPPAAARFEDAPAGADGEPASGGV